jgi:ferritin-like metal-binding protein YciE
MLPKLGKTAQSRDLKDAFETHRKQTEEHIKHLSRSSK